MPDPMTLYFQKTEKYVVAIDHIGKVWYGDIHPTSREISLKGHPFQDIEEYDSVEGSVRISHVGVITPEGGVIVHQLPARKEFPSLYEAYMELAPYARNQGYVIYELPKED